MSADVPAEKFLYGSWTCYELTDWQMHYSEQGSYSLLQFMRCFESLASKCAVRVTPVAFGHLLCCSMSLLPTSPPQAQQQQKKGKKKGGAGDQPEPQGLGDVFPSSHKKPISFKVVLDWCAELLLVNRRLPTWLEEALSRSVGCAKLSVLCNFRGDARHLLQLRNQRGTEGGDFKSAQAVLEHEWQEALLSRGRLMGHSPPLGDVTLAVGAIPSNFPAVSCIAVTAKNVPMPSVKQIKSSLSADKLAICQQRLSALRLSEVSFTVHSPSLLHLYYNAALESYRRNEEKQRSANEPITSEIRRWPPPVGSAPSPREEEAADRSSKQGKSKKVKTNLDGVVKMAPVFLEKLRSSASFRPVLEYS